MYKHYTQYMDKTIIDFISGVPVYPTPEEVVVQALSKWLVAIGYPKEHIQTQPQYRIFDPQNKRSYLRVEIAVFRSARHNEDNLLLIAEVKKEHTNNGLDQLHKYLRLSGAQLGIWFNGDDLTYLVNVPNARAAVGEIEKLRGAGFGDYVRNRRESLRSVDAIRFSGRAVASRLGCEPSYLNRIELGRDRPPSDELLSKLALELDVSEDTLFAQAGRISPRLRALVLVHPNEYLQMFEAIDRRIESGAKPEEVLRRVLALIERDSHVKDGEW